MATQYGTLSVIDTLDAYNEASVLDIGEEEINGFIRQILDAYNSQVGDLFGDLVGFVPDRETTYGVDSTAGEMVDLDEYGLADAQKFPFAPSTVGFPLRRKGATLQWTRDYLARTTPGELGRQVLGLTEADTRAVYAALRIVLFKATNNTTYIDRLVDNRAFTIRALVNADSQAIPPQPVTNATFNAATHTHYLATASFVEANLISLEDTVHEHWAGDGAMKVYINKAQEATVRAFSGFRAYVDARLVMSTAADRAAQAVDLIQLQDRAIGFHGPAEVWVKPWIPASYVLCFIDAAAGDPVVGWRRPDGALAEEANLGLRARIDRHPLHAEGYSHVFGLGIWNRTRAAVLFTGSGTYASFAG
jgi:hypothetical protein